MRPLTTEETKAFFEKLSKEYACSSFTFPLFPFSSSRAVFSLLKKSIGKNIAMLIDRKDDEHCFRLHKDRVYYISEALMRRATNIEGSHLLSMGTCFGKFSKSKKFKLHITALSIIAQYASVCLSLSRISIISRTSFRLISTIISTPVQSLG